MNENAISELIDFMEKCEYKFDMTTSKNHIDPRNQCGTAGCIAGHAALLWPEIRAKFSPSDGNIIQFICHFPLLEEKLQISGDKFARLINPTRSRDGISCMHDDINKDWAIRTMKHLLATGKVDWEITK